MKNEMCANAGNSQKARMCVSTADGLNPWYLSMGFRPGVQEKSEQAGKIGWVQRQGAPETKPPNRDFT